MDQTPLEEFKRLHNTFLYIDYKTSDLAKYLNVSRRTVERWLSSKYIPSESKMKLIKKYLSSKPRYI